MLIESSRWTDYFAELSRQAEGYDTRIEVLSGELGYQVEMRRAPLIELAFDVFDALPLCLGQPRVRGRRREQRRTFGREAIHPAVEARGIHRTRACSSPELPRPAHACQSCPWMIESNVSTWPPKSKCAW